MAEQMRRAQLEQPALHCEQAVSENAGARPLLLFPVLLIFHRDAPNQMNAIQALLRRQADYFGAHLVSHRATHERDRCFQRAVGTLGVMCVLLFEVVTDRVEPAVRYELLACLVYLTCSVAYGRVLANSPEAGIATQYVFLILDPIFLVNLLIVNPEVFAYMNAFVLVVIVRSGIRYGVRVMYLSWMAASAASSFLASSQFWVVHSELLLSFVFTLLSAPAFFTGLIRRTHKARTLEEDRTRLSAMNEALVARSSFLAKVSHELRSPLQNIVSALDLFEMRHASLGRSDDELIGRMRRSSLLLNTQLRDLLTLAKGEAGRLELRPEPFEACALVESMADGARDLAKAKGLELTVYLPADAVFVVADGARIDQILTNLVINSIRYTDVGQVRVSLHAFDPVARRLHLVVADTGPGIPGDVIPALFAPDRASTGTERRGEGSGIGLAIVRTLMAQLGGTVAVTSELGRGTTFTLDIPAEPVIEDDPSYADVQPARILIVDDRNDVLDALASVVDELGYECDRASSAAIAGNLAAARCYAAILVDLDMPLKGGAELASEIRSGKGLSRQTRLIAMSTGGTLRGGDRQPFDLVLPKPIDHAALRHALHGPGFGARPSQPGLWADDDAPAPRQQ